MAIRNESGLIDKGSIQQDIYIRGTENIRAGARGHVAGLAYWVLSNSFGPSSRNVWYGMYDSEGFLRFVRLFG